MSKFIYYSPVTGAITKIITCNDEDAVSNKESNEEILKVSDDIEVDDALEYVDIGAKVICTKQEHSKEQFISVTAGDIVTITLPEKCCVSMEGDAEDYFYVDDGQLDLQFSTPGVYVLSFEMVHYTNGEVHIHVQED